MWLQHWQGAVPSRTSAYDGGSEQSEYWAQRWLSAPFFSGRAHRQERDDPILAHQDAPRHAAAISTLIRHFMFLLSALVSL